jgi:hypothetical protein
MPTPLDILLDPVTLAMMGFLTHGALESPSWT